MLSGVGVICFAASYLVAFALELTRLMFRSGIRGTAMLGFAGAGLVAHTAYLYYQFSSAPGSPLSSERDWYYLAAWALVVLYLYLTYYHPKAPFGPVHPATGFGAYRGGAFPGRRATIRPRTGLGRLG